MVSSKISQHNDFPNRSSSWIEPEAIIGNVSTALVEGTNSHVKFEKLNFPVKLLYKNVHKNLTKILIYLGFVGLEK